MHILAKYMKGLKKLEFQLALQTIISQILLGLDKIYTPFTPTKHV